MAPQDNLEHYEATEAQDLTRLLYALRPPEREVQVPPQVDITIRAEIWKAQVRRQVITLLPMAHRELAQGIRQALTDNPMLEEVTPPEDEDPRASQEHAPRLTASADDLMGHQELYDNVWQACVPDGWDANGLPAQASKAPGPSEHSSGPPEVIVPDVIVKPVGHAYQVVLNEAGMPQLRLSQTYRRLRREDHLGPPEAKAYLDDKLRSAVWLIRSLEHRRQMLFTVAHSLVAQQRAFLDHGLAHLKPLALTDVADALGMHASTVRLVISNKYLATAHGIVALTSFFAQESPAVREEPMVNIAMISQSPKMQEVYRHIEQVLHTTVTVLIRGEDGTGKGLVARIIHEHGSRRQGPFMAVSCAGIPETRLEAELFVHMERAAGGTLFVDGIAEMSPALQAKLLRVLQEKRFERGGGTEALPTDARIIAAATPELERLIAEGKFRHDLYYRLNVSPITLPPLRERQEDLGPLTMHFLKRFSQEFRKEVLSISEEAMGLLERYSWPGNVRELENVIERAVNVCQGTIITAQELPSLRENSTSPVPNGEDFRRPSSGLALGEMEKELICQALEQTHQNKSLAARKLGLSRAQLRARMRLYGLE